jgi:molecular chaperone GrpE
MDNQQKNTDDQLLETDEDLEMLTDIQQDIIDNNLPQKHLEEITALKEQVEILQDKLLRTIAESENTRKRLEKSIEDARDYAIISFAKDLLTVSDNLSRALEHKPKNIEGEISNIITGVEMTRSDLTNILKKHGLESIEPLLGEKFDYNIHYAISPIISDEHDKDTIMAIMQSGYKLKDRLLRPATVQVSKKSS